MYGNHNRYGIFFGENLLRSQIKYYTGIKKSKLGFWSGSGSEPVSDPDPARPGDPDPAGFATLQYTHLRMGPVLNAVLRIRDVYPGSRILIFTHPRSRIQK